MTQIMTAAFAAKKGMPTIETESFDITLPPLTGRTNFLSPTVQN